MTRPPLLLLLAVVVAPRGVAADRPDILIADYEGDTYPVGWTTTGTAFGKGPAKGTLPDQMPVSGFLGKGLVNSYLGGDAATGTLTSPEFKLERKYINFLVGGGKHPGKTCVNLLVDGKVVRTATGPNDRPGGSEHLDWHTWDVAEFEGRAAVIRVVDDATGGWGHISVDQIVQGDTKNQAEPAARSFAVDRTYLHLPVKTGAPGRRVRFVVGGATVREFDIELDTTGAPDVWAFADLSPFRGKTLTVETALPGGAKALDALRLAADVPAADKLYREKYRPLFHFTSRFGWLNDPNGLVYHAGEWHLFYQHNPFGVNWGNMHWGHAVSPDIVHWKELGIGLYPKQYDDWAFSGSAVVDVGNTSGWGTAGKPPLVLAYTSTGRGECVAHSTDGGRTWTEFDANPVVKHAGRDPKLIWYAPGKHWVMAVYDEFQGKQWIAFHTSPDLKTWTFASRIDGFFECPDLFELPVGGDPKATKWVLSAADGKYVTGDFDGKEFRPDSKAKKQLWHGRFYAAQTFDHAPADKTGRPRRVQIGWANGVTFPGMPFNQQMTVPVELELIAGQDGPQMTARPVPELNTLREEAYLATEPTFFTSHPENAGKSQLAQPAGESGQSIKRLEAFDLEAEIELGTADEVGFDLRGTKLVYDVKKGVLTCKDVSAPVRPGGKTLRLRILVDRGSVEVFADGGRVALSVAAVTGEKPSDLAVLGRGGDVKMKRLQIWAMKSAWEK